MKDTVRKRESVHVEACDDAKVVRTAFESPPEIRILCGVGVDDVSTGENDLEIGYAGAVPTTAAEEVGQTIWRIWSEIFSS